MNTNLIDIQAQGKQIRIEGVISDDQDAMDKLAIALDSVEDDYELYINTYGGSVFAANEMVNKIKAKGYNPSIKLGAVVASAGTYIASSFGKVTAYANTRYMIHKPYTAIYGNEDEIATQQKLIQSLTKDYLDVYSHKTGISAEDIEALWKSDYWMDATEAKELGFIDEIIPINQNKKPMKTETEKQALGAIAQALNIKGDDQKSIIAHVQGLESKVQILQNELDQRKLAEHTAKIDALVALGREQGKIDDDTEPSLRALAEKDLVSASSFLEGLKPVSVSTQIEEGADETEGWTFSDWAKKDPQGLNRLKAEAPEDYKKLLETNKR